MRGRAFIVYCDRYVSRLRQKHNRADRTYLTYRYTLDVLLRQPCATPFVEDISREDILKFITDCYKLGLGGRTVYDKLVIVLQMFKRYGRTKLIERNDWPDYVEKTRPIYEPEEIQTLLRNADTDEAIFLKFLLGSGFRDREAQHVTWRDLDFHNSVVRVIEKPKGHQGSGRRSANGTLPTPNLS
jgi:integrase/recombinase XerD